MPYCFDTSAFINPWFKYYRIANFPNLWKKIEEAIENGTIISPMEVFEDIKKKDDELLAWLKARQKVFLELDKQVEDSLTNTILERHPAIVNPNNTRNKADPWVIALALVRNAAVVHDEKSGSQSKHKIPDYCRQLGVRHISMADFISDQNWVF